MLTLVKYCGRDCQTKHWAQHKKDYKSSFMKDDWQPQWIHERRKPSFISNETVLSQFGGKKHLWGNVPALDVVRLSTNEGANYKKDLRLLFAGMFPSRRINRKERATTKYMTASGDLRNMIKSVAALPQQYNSTIAAFINDKDFDIVARNLIILLIALVVLDKTEAAECMLHVWYSAFIRQKDADILTNQILPLIDDVNNKTASKPSATLLGKTWTFGSHTCRVELPKENWILLRSFLQNPKGFSAEEAQDIRTRVTLAPERRDYRE